MHTYPSMQAFQAFAMYSYQSAISKEDDLTYEQLTKTLYLQVGPFIFAQMFAWINVILEPRSWLATVPKITVAPFPEDIITEIITGSV